MSEMVERIAQAALALDDTVWVGHNQMLYFRRVAVAAIEAMREPTIGMIAMGGDEILPERMYRLMIDAALDDDLVDKDRK